MAPTKPSKISKETTVESLAAYLERIRAIRDAWFGGEASMAPWFRGQQRSYWPLVPKLYRDFGNYKFIEKNDIEREICEEFLVRAPILSETKPAENDSWEWYFLMQHYGTATRLLDWTEGALIALYFAEKDNRGFYDAVVWALDPYDLNKMTIRSGQVIPPSAPRVSKKDKRLVRPWMPVTSPSFCTTASERVYITTSSGKGANGGSQGAVGDRRAAICGAKVTGAGGL